MKQLNLEVLGLKEMTKQEMREAYGGRPKPESTIGIAITVIGYGVVAVVTFSNPAGWVYGALTATGWALEIAGGGLSIGCYIGEWLNGGGGGGSGIMKK